MPVDRGTDPPGPVVGEGGRRARRRAGRAAAAPGPSELTAEVMAVGRAQGLHAVGVTPAVPFADTRRVLEERKAAGLAAGMQFTYRDPARSSDPSRALRDARSVVVGARGYLRTARARDPGRPRGRVARYAWSDEYAGLRAGLGAVADHLRAAGGRAVVLADDNSLVDRAAAARAGLGWFGKNSMLLLPGAGSWFVLGSVVTDVELAPPPGPAAEPGAPAAGCGSCTRCLPACPTGALVAPGVLDARRCLAWLVQAPGPFPVEYREVLGDRLYGCDDCQDACPVNRVAARRDPPDPAGGDVDDSVDVLALLAASDEEILARWGRWYIADRDPTTLRRNALLVLGNSGRGSDAEVLAAVRAALADRHPVLRATAVWAAGRLGLGDEARRLADDRDGDVRREVAALAGWAP